ncbi:MAG TPA: zinc-ribbon domain-containing protein [Terriglobales bacterium]|nr:zinc-ribbon domain-containing protein [Terriglobales bacterium]
MAAFCVSCGSALGEGARFCPKCGTAVESETVMAPPLVNAPAPTAGPIPRGGGSNTAVKVIFVILGVIMFIGLLGLGTCFYLGYRVKQKAGQISREMGADAPRYTGRREPCAMLSTAEASKALGQPVASVEQMGITTCEYHYGAGGSGRLPIQYTWEGGAITLKLAHAAMKQVAAGMDTYTALPGIGDEAYLEPAGSGLVMRKGDVMVHIDLRVANLSPNAAKALAAVIASRL